MYDSLNNILLRQDYRMNMPSKWDIKTKSSLPPPVKALKYLQSRQKFIENEYLGKKMIIQRKLATKSPQQRRQSSWITCRRIGQYFLQPGEVGQLIESRALIPAKSDKYKASDKINKYRKKQPHVEQSQINLVLSEPNNPQIYKQRMKSSLFSGVRYQENRERNIKRAESHYQNSNMNQYRSNNTAEDGKGKFIRNNFNSNNSIKKNYRSVEGSDFKKVKFDRNIKKNKKQSKEKEIKGRNKPMFFLDSKFLAQITADSFIVTSKSNNKIIIGNSFRKNMQIASLTKIMTFYTAFMITKNEQISISQQKVYIDEEMISITGTSAELCSGDIFRLQHLFYGLMLPSGNDAALALAKWGGNRLGNKSTPVKRFIQEMNYYARKLDLSNTQFSNPHGLPSQNSGSTSEDLAQLVGHCLSQEFFCRVVGTKVFKCKVENEEEGCMGQVVWENTQKLLRRPNFTGVKTGITTTAGPCLVTSYESPSSSETFVIVILQTSKLSRRFKETRYLLAYALRKLDYCERQINEILRQDPELDSDNSEEEEEFISGIGEVRKKWQILLKQM